MAFPSPAHANTPQSSSQSTPSASPASLPTGTASPGVMTSGLPRGGHHHAAPGVASRPFPPQQARGCDGEHQLEKLQFALAVALTRGDRDREHRLREQIAALGGNGEEPGT